MNRGRPKGARNKPKDPISARLAYLCDLHIGQQVEAIGIAVIPKLLGQINVVLEAFGIEPTPENRTKMIGLVAQVFTEAKSNDPVSLMIAQRIAHAWHDELALTYIDKALAEMGGAKEREA